MMATLLDSVVFDIIIMCLVEICLYPNLTFDLCIENMYTVYWERQKTRKKKGLTVLEKLESCKDSCHCDL